MSGRAGSGSGVSVRLDGVTKAYGAKIALRDVSFTVGDGEFIALLGPNGAGKTTTLEILMG